MCNVLYQWLTVIVLHCNIRMLGRFLSYKCYASDSLSLVTRVTLYQARQSLIVRGLFPMLADPRHPVSLVLSSFLLHVISSFLLDKQTISNVFHLYYSLRPR